MDYYTRAKHKNLIDSTLPATVVRWKSLETVRPKHGACDTDSIPENIYWKSQFWKKSAEVKSYKTRAAVDGTP